MGIITEGFPADSAAVYSLVYNLVYLVPDMIITMVVLAVLVATKNFPRLVRLMRPDFYAKIRRLPPKSLRTPNKFYLLKIREIRLPCGAVLFHAIVKTFSTLYVH